MGLNIMAGQNWVFTITLWVVNDFSLLKDLGNERGDFSGQVPNVEYLVEREGLGPVTQNIFTNLVHNTIPRSA